MSRGSRQNPSKEQRIIHLLDRVYNRLEELEKAFDELYAEKEELKTYLQEMYEQNKRLKYDK